MAICSSRAGVAAISSSPRPRSRSARARCNNSTISSAVSARSAYTRERDSSAAITSNDGFSVVAPIRTISPRSTYGRNASCCALLKRWISSMKTIVRRPERRRRSASTITALISLMPLSTALNGMNSERLSRAISRARLVLPTPGGPHRITELNSSCSICRRRGLPGPSTWSCPANSSNVTGRMRSASGRFLSTLSGSPSGAVRRSPDRRAGASCPLYRDRRAGLRRTDSSVERPLAPGFVQQNAGRNRGVERLDARGRDADIDGGGAQLRTHAARFVADDDRATSGEIHLAQRLRWQARVGGHARIDIQLVLLERRAGQRRIQAVGKGYAEQRSGGGAQRFGIEGTDGALQKHDAGGAERLGGAGDGAGVSGVLQAIQHHHQAASAKQLRQVPDRRLDQRDHALAGFGAGYIREKLVGDHGHAHAGEALDVAFDRGLHGFRAQHHLDGAAAAQGFFQQVESLRHQVAFLREAAAGDGAAHVLNERVGRARNRLGLRHLTMCLG